MTRQAALAFALIACGGVALILVQFGPAADVRPAPSVSGNAPDGSSSHESTVAGRNDKRTVAPDPVPALRQDARAAEPRAPSPSAPVLTLTGAIEALLNDDPMGTEAEQFGTPMTSAFVLSGMFNPEERVPNAQQAAQLEEMVKEYNSEKTAILKENGKLTKQALFRSLAIGQVASVIKVAPSATISMADARKADAEQYRKVSDDLQARLGTFLEDWASSTVYTTKPDGVARANVVYFTKQDAPDVFAVRARLNKFELARAKQFREFVETFSR